MSRIVVVTDSGSDLPPGFAAAHGVEIVPLLLHVDGKEYLDGVDISHEEFYRLLTQQRVMELRTSQPSPASFRGAFERAAGRGETVLCICLSSQVSGTYQSAVLGAQMSDVNVRIEVFDSLSASVGSGLLVVRAVELAEQGRGIDEILLELARIRNSMKVLFLVDTLEYLQKNGRIGKAQAVVGTLLKMKPVLTLEGGVVGAKERVRGQLRAMDRLVELVAEEFKSGHAEIGGSLMRGAIAHAAAPERACQLHQKLLDQQLGWQDLWIGAVGPAIGVHSGPGLVGIAFYPVNRS